MRVNYSEKVDRLILSNVLGDLIHEAKEVIYGNKPEIINNMIGFETIVAPDWIEPVNVYVDEDARRYTSDKELKNDLLAIKHGGNPTEEQIKDYKEFLVKYSVCRNAKFKYIAAFKLVNIISFTDSYRYNERTPWFFICLSADGLREWGLNDRVRDINNLEAVIDESKPNYGVNIKPITLDMIVDQLLRHDYRLIEGTYYQVTDDEYMFDIEAFVDGLDTSVMLDVLTSIIRTNIVIDSQVSSKAKGNIDSAITKANNYMQALPLSTKLIEVDIMGQYIKSLLNTRNLIVDDGVFDEASLRIADTFKDINPDDLCDDLIVVTKDAAKFFKNAHDNNMDRTTYTVNNLTLKTTIPVNRFTLNYSDINKLSLETYVAD